MKIMVFDVPAENGGALTILNQYYDNAIKDKENEWIFVLSTPQLSEHSNVKILNFPWVKKSWFHRLYFDKVVANKIVKSHNVDEILSLQNVIVRSANIKQTLYLHQPLPFVKKKYKIYENFIFWTYQNLIGKMIFKSIKRADNIIVQTKWMKEAVIKKVKINGDKITLKEPKLNINVESEYKESNRNEKLFFYPAGSSLYKNHRVIIEACRIINNKSIKNYKVVFTLYGDENKNIKNLYDIAKKENLPIAFIGKINIDEVCRYYSKSILLFPSYIETYGLPMLEAKMHLSPIIASDCAFSHEILDGYEKADFFDPYNSHQLSEYMERYLR